MADKTHFWSDSVNDWIKALQSDPSGLTEADARERLKNQSGRVHSSSHWQKDLLLLLSQFRSPLMFLLIGAVVLSFFLGDSIDAIIILFILLSTGLLSFFQERNAGRVVEKLQQLIAIQSTVLRNHQAVNVPANQLVPGDIILLDAGDLIAADCLLMEANELHVNEASLTGESFPVRKESGILDAGTALAARTNCLWEGTNVISGTATALVIQTGSDTLFGKMVKSTSATEETSFEKGIRDFGYFLMKVTLVLSILILVINLLHHKPVMESALFALALAVGMAPELLPAITTIAMSAGANRMLAKKVIVKKLSSIQNLGEVNLLCTDKTGTITEGVIAIDAICDAEGQPNAEVRALAYWNALFESGYANPIDDALRAIKDKPIETVQKTGEIPYDFIRKRLSIAVNRNGQTLLISKGAFDQVLAVCQQVRMPDGQLQDLISHESAIRSRYQSFGVNGWRVIAVAYKAITKTPPVVTDEAEMIFAGFVLMQDPVKPGIRDTLRQLNQLGVSLKIITGDNQNVATAIARQLGIESPVVVTGAALLAMSPEALVHQAGSTHVFAEVEPQQKERIIRALRETHHVAYMGDGINDVSAIHAADAGISVNNAVDIAKEAADFVLMEKDLSVVVDGIMEGRKTFANTLKYIFINTGSTFGNMFSVATASLILPFLPMLPKQILLTNFITDFPYLSIAADEVDAEQLNRPGKWNIQLIRRYMILFGIHSSLFDVLTFLLLFFLLRSDAATFQTGWFIESVLTELFILFIIRTRKNFFLSRPGKYLSWLSLLGLLLTIGLPYTPWAADIGFVPLPVSILGWMLLMVLLYVLTADWLKVWFFRRFADA